MPVPAASDDCPDPVIITNDFNGTADASGDYPVGTTTINWSFADGAGNVVTATSTVTVTDDVAPIVNCPPSQTINLASGECTALVSYVATATDNCPCLLYTSPSPRDGLLSRMPSSA